MRTKRISGVGDVTTYVGERFTAERAVGGALHKALAKHLSVGQRLEGGDGQQIIERARTAVEEQLAKTLRGLDAASMLLAARCISARVWASFDEGDSVQPAVRSILELAVKKHATWSGSDRNIEAMPAFSRRELAALAQAFVLSETYSGLLAMERRVCKGQAQTVTSVSPLSYYADTGSPSLERLIEVRDRRSAVEIDPLGPFGTVSSAADAVPVPFILSADWVAPSEVLDPSGEPAYEQTSRGNWIRTGDRTTRWGFIEGIEACQQALRLYDQSLRDTVGCGLIDLHAFEHVVTLAVLEHYEDTGLSPALELLGIAEVPPLFAPMILDIAGTHPYDTMDPDLVPTMAGVSRAYELLMTDPATIDLSNPTVNAPWRG